MMSESLPRLDYRKDLMRIGYARLRESASKRR
jgi:hypothetical protein